jgi:hypothetical protein
MSDAHLLDEYLVVYRDGGRRKQAIRAELESRLAAWGELVNARAEIERLRDLIRQYVHATDELAVDDSSETQSRYERTEDALREVARG